MIIVRDVVRELVSESAPQELPVVDGLRQFDDDEAVRVLAGGAAGKEPLGFGFAEAAPLVTSVVWLVLDQVAHSGADVLTESALKRVWAAVRRALRRGGDAPPRTLPPLSRGQLALVHARVIEDGTAKGMRRRDAEALADRVVAKLTTLPDAPLDDVRVPQE